MRDGIAVVRAEGEIDLETADTLASALGSQIAAGVDGVVLDLLGVPFMDSSGLKQLLAASNELRDRLVVVLSLGSPVRRLLELAEISDRVAVHENDDDAVAALAPAGG
jgi:anti-anti-sigma factor